MELGIGMNMLETGCRIRCQSSSEVKSSPVGYLKVRRVGDIWDLTVWRVLFCGSVFA